MEIIENDWSLIVDEHFKNIRDVYFSFDFYTLFAKHFSGKPQGIFWEDENIVIFWPHLIRTKSEVNLEMDFNYEFFDLTTPYGYGGPLIKLYNEDQKKVKKSISDFLIKYRNHCKKNNFKTEFIRFHPFAKSWQTLNQFTDLNIKYGNEVVIVDLEPEIDTIFSNLSKSRRKNVRRGYKEEYEINIENKPSEDQIQNFLELYYDTMGRRNADKRYYFTKEFVNDHFKITKSVLIEAIIKGNVIGALICLEGEDYVHTQLTGFEYEYRNFFPSPIVHWEAIKYAKENNKKYFHFGGGNEQILNFKMGFSKNTLPFYYGILEF